MFQKSKIILLIVLFFISTILIQTTAVANNTKKSSTQVKVKKSNPSTKSQAPGSAQIRNKFKEPKKLSTPINSSATNHSTILKETLVNDLNKLLNILKSNKTPFPKESNPKSLQKIMTENKIRPRFLSFPQLTDYNKLKSDYGDRIKIKWSEKNGTPVYIDFSEAASPKLSKTRTSLKSKELFTKSFLNQFKRLLKLENPVEELLLEKAETDEIGFTHLRYFQHYKGLKVWARDIYVHYNHSGGIQSMNGRYEPTPLEITDVNYSISNQRAQEIAYNDLGFHAKSIHETVPEKIIYFDKSSKPHLAWFVEVIPDLLYDYYYFIDGKNGAIIHKYNNCQTDGPIKGSGTDLLGKTRNLDLYQIGSDYFMINTAKDMFSSQNSTLPNDPAGAITILDLKNDSLHQNSRFSHVTSTNKTQWAPNSVSLAYNFSITYDYYKTVHNRKSLDNQGLSIYGIINMGNKFMNAFWQPTLKMLFFGNGDGYYCTDFTGGLDIVAHEYGHGVTQFSSNLEYLSQSGALNEAFSDFSGVMVEFYEDPNNANWLMGENVMGPGSTSNAGRDLANPNNIPLYPGASEYFPAKMSEYYELPETEDGDYGGVHINCTIPGHAIYLISESVGKDKMEKIIYRAYMHYLTRKSQFIDLRFAAIQSAKDLYPGAGIDIRVGQSFDLVEIFDGNPTEPDDPYQPVSGQDFILMVHTDNSRIFSAKPDIPFDNSSANWFDAYTSNKPSITEDGSLVVYVGSDQNIYQLDVANNQSTQLSEDGLWHNIAVSPKGDYLAIIPDPDEMPSTIFIGDVATGTLQARTLYIPNTGTGSFSNANYADILDWSNCGGFLIYDCYYETQLQDGTTIGSWGIYLMQAHNETIISLFQPMNDIAVGNPAFSNTSDNLIAFDMIDYTNDKNNPSYSVLSGDMFTGDLGIIHENSNFFGHPSFSPDDKKVVFQDKKSDGTMFLSQITLNQDGLNGDQSSYKPWVHPVQMPVWYATGSRPSSTTILLSEGFDAESFPPENWQIFKTDQTHTWKRGNVADHNFSTIDPASKYSAICPYSENTDQRETLFSKKFSLGMGDAGLTFHTGYNSSWLNNYSFTLWITDSQNLDQKIWEATNDSETKWKWRKITIDLSTYAGMSNLSLKWRYVGKDGDLVALDGIDLSGIITGVEPQKKTDSNLCDQFILNQNYPNPFNPTTTIGYDLPEAAAVNIKIFDITGRNIRTLENRVVGRGRYQLQWDGLNTEGKRAASGIYFYRLSARPVSGGKTRIFTNRMLLLK